MAFTSYLKSCVRNTPGNQYQVYLAPIASLTSITVTSNAISAVTMNGGALFQRAQGKLDQVRMVKAANATNNFSETHTLSLRFDKATPTLAAWLYGTDGIADAIVCGMVAIRVDGNGQAWLSGASPAAVEGLLRPYQKATINFDSGIAPTEEDAAQPELILERNGAAQEYAFDSTLNAAIVGGTSAFINWAT